LTEDHGDKLGRRVLRSSEKRYCSRTLSRRSVKHGSSEDLLLFSTTPVAMRKKIQPRSG
jgi:hypothetical protein